MYCIHRFLSRFTFYREYLKTEKTAVYGIIVGNELADGLYDGVNKKRHP